VLVFFCFYFHIKPEAPLSMLGPSPPEKSSKRKPGRPVGSKNRTLEEKEQEKRKTSVHNRGRPRGSKNKKGTKVRPPAKVSYAHLYMNATGAPPPLGMRKNGTILDLLQLLDKVVADYWTDQRVLQVFRSGESSVHEIENQCHFYASSKGRLISTDNNTLSSCVLFPGVNLSSEFLDQYLHTFDDVLTYGDYVSQVTQKLERRAIALSAS
jgi:hypothetical protein